MLWVSFMLIIFYLYLIFASVPTIIALLSQCQNRLTKWNNNKVGKTRVSERRDIPYTSSSNFWINAHGYNNKEHVYLNIVSSYERDNPFPGNIKFIKWNEKCKFYSARLLSTCIPCNTHYYLFRNIISSTVYLMTRQLTLFVYSTVSQISACCRVTNFFAYL